MVDCFLFAVFAFAFAIVVACLPLLLSRFKSLDPFLSADPPKDLACPSCAFLPLFSLLQYPLLNSLPQPPPKLCLSNATPNHHFQQPDGDISVSNKYTSQPFSSPPSAAAAAALAAAARAVAHLARQQVLGELGARRAVVVMSV